MHEMTKLQAAYWVGRQHIGDRTGDAAHLYVEFSGENIDPSRLARAVNTVFLRHEMLRVKVSEQGQLSIAQPSELHRLTVNDWRNEIAVRCEEALGHLRAVKTHQKLDLANGQGAEFCLSVLPDDRFVLHIDVDMIAADAQSFRILIHDLAAAYHDELLGAPTTAFFEYLAQQQLQPGENVHRYRSRTYWQECLRDIAPAPQLPARVVPPSSGNVAKTGKHTRRLAGQLTATQRMQLEALAARHHLTLTSLSLAAFNAVLANALGQVAFRINVPLFYRPEPYAGTVGDFANLTLFSAHCGPEAELLHLCQQTQQQLSECLEYRHYSGVNVMRDLSRREGAVQASPVVFTSGWDIGGDLFSSRVHQTFGDMVWACSQGAHVLLDAQIVPYQQGVLLNWDVRTDEVDFAFYQQVFERYAALLQELAANPERINQPYQVTESPAYRQQESPLRALQQAYLIGRSDLLPLGGVAMHDFRVYRGHLDIAQLEKRLAELVDQLDVLRTHIDESSLTQWVCHQRRVNFEHCDLRALPREAALAEAESLIASASHHRHDLSVSPWKVWAVSLPEASISASKDERGYRNIVLTSFDALIADGHSIAFMVTSLLEDVPKTVPVTQADSAPELPAQKRLEDEQYWTDKLAAVTEPVELPWRQPLDAIDRPRFARETVTLSATDTRALFKVAAKARLFPNSLLTALVMETLACWSPQGKLCLGLPVAPPPKAGELENRSSFIALNYLNHSQDFVSRARQVQRDIAEGMGHLDFSGIEMNRLLLSRMPARSIPLPVVITHGLGWETLPEGNAMQQSGGLTQTPQIALDIRFAYDEQKNLLISADYVTQALDTELVQRWLNAWKQAALAMVANDRVDWQSGTALDLAHYHRNGHEADFVCSQFLATIARRLFETPDQRTALICGEQRWCYADLGRQISNMIARLQSFGLKPGDVVAICLPRSPEHVMLTLSCALAGFIWVPIDASSPAERSAYLLSNCQAALVVTQEDSDLAHGVSLIELMSPAREAAMLPNWQTLCIRSQSDAPAYYLYTSGTTGQPKCVVLNNRATSNVLQQTLSQWQVTERDVMMSVTPLHHDMSVFDLFGSLCAGATLVIPEPHAEKDAIHWNELVTRHGVTIWCSVPAILEMLLACQSPEQGHTLRLVAQGGDYIKPQTIDTLRARLPQARLFSLGGPTETTIWSIWHELSEQDRDVVPYGQPLPGNQYYIVNTAHQHCPAGVVGRIVTAGVNLSLGYLMDGVITQRDFIDLVTPQGHTVRAFKTGDQGYYRDDGTIIFAGRIHGYVKVRGVRVSLPDIEKVLLEAAHVCDLAVIDYQNEASGDTELALFYTADDVSELSSAMWRDLISQHLPLSHMPSHFVCLEHFPLSANGKKDKRALLQHLMQRHTEHSVPEDQEAEPVWQTIVQVYQQVLGTQSGALTQETEFVQAGLRPQHLKAIAGHLSERLGLPVQPRQLLNCKNISQVVQLLA